MHQDFIESSKTGPCCKRRPSPFYDTRKEMITRKRVRGVGGDYKSSADVKCTHTQRD